MKKNYSLNRNIQDNIDSDRYYQMITSRDLYKGTSFKVNEWKEDTHYFNDANIIDFIYFEGCLLVCKRSHVSSEANKPVLVFDNGNPINVKDNIYWDLAISKGDKGETGVGEKGDKGDKGDPGTGVIAGGQTGQVLAKDSDSDFDTVWKTISDSGSEIPDFSAEVTSTTSSEVANASVVLEDNIFKFSFDLPKGEPGRDGQDGQNGQDGKDAVTPDWKTYVYKQSDDKPDKPDSTDIIPSGWVDYPNNTGQWWQCIGTVNGETNQVTEWSEVLPVNGRDGVAQDGKWTEMRFAVNNSATEAPSLENSVRTPDGWTTNPPSVESGQFLWMTMAVINPDDTLVDTWSTPVRISGEKGDKGEQGEQGPAGEPGSQGIAGIPGLGIEVRYSIGTKESPIDSAESNPGSNREPAGWTTFVPETDEENPYLWFIQAKIKYSNNEDTTGQIDGEWSSPHRLSGTNGIDGTVGKKGQIVYPAGIYEVDKAYTTDDNKAPYVLDVYNSEDVDVYEYYILNKVGTWKGTEHNSKAPHEDTEGYWVKMESFDAIYSAIGVFSQALVGSAVFSGDYVFSQQGIDSTGASSTSYELFSSENPIGGVFTPNICFNFKTGSGHLAAGKIQFDANGNLNMNDLKVTNIDIQGVQTENFGEQGLEGDYNIYDLNCQLIVDTQNEVFNFRPSPEKYKLTPYKFYKGTFINLSRFSLTIKLPDYINGHTAYTINGTMNEDEGYTFSFNEIVLRPDCPMIYVFRPSGSRDNYYTGSIYIYDIGNYDLEARNDDGELEEDGLATRRILIQKRIELTTKSTLLKYVTSK